jgi:flagellar hook capping protein FlgD
MMRRTIALSIATLALLAGLAVADPEISVTYQRGAAVIQLAGNYAGSSYSVYRSDIGNPNYRLIYDSNWLCLGDCVVADYEAAPGATYLYRFDLYTPSGPAASFGPYEVKIPRQAPVSAAIFPNPGSGPATIAVTLGGRPSDPPLPTEVALYDLEGRVVRTLHRGPLSRGYSALVWDGRDASGLTLGSGLYFLRVRSAAGDVTARVVRAR